MGNKLQVFLDNSKRVPCCGRETHKTPFTPKLMPVCGFLNMAKLANNKRGTVSPLTVDQSCVRAFVYLSKARRLRGLKCVFINAHRSQS